MNYIYYRAFFDHHWLTLMATKSFELRAFFHLTLLRQLGIRLSGRSYAVKGGICLRFFHRSPRLSEDMDLDIVSQVRLETLRNAVDSVIDGRAMLATLISAGVTAVQSTKPKQTEAIQRWKVMLQTSGGEELGNGTVGHEAKNLTALRSIEGRPRRNGVAPSAFLTAPPRGACHAPHPSDTKELTDSSR